jgi:catechol 2,3-dioxygenase-like lactoylglutathione lyase family enzyme
MKMPRWFLRCALLAMVATPYALAQQQRPAITGISHMCVLAHDMAASEIFYVHDLGATKGSDPQDLAGVRYYFSPTQFIEVLPLPAVTLLIQRDRLSPRHDGPQMGKDGKWQANFYDPDGTRVELMEFQPVAKPCCSPFTAASPSR